MTSGCRVSSWFRNSLASISLFLRYSSSYCFKITSTSKRHLKKTPNLFYRNKSTIYWITQVIPTWWLRCWNAKRMTLELINLLLIQQLKHTQRIITVYKRKQSKITRTSWWNVSFDTVKIAKLGNRPANQSSISTFLNLSFQKMGCFQEQET